MKSYDGDGYISRYLIHWTGKNKDTGVDDNEEGARILSAIASERRLRFSANPVYRRDCFTEIHDKMICFTDVPTHLSATHCTKYGQFGIALHKLPMMNMGAQPVFYTTHVWKRELDTIFDFLQKQSINCTLEPRLFSSLMHHFYFFQHFSTGCASSAYTCYYEREWRLGSHGLPLADELNRDNGKWRCIQEGYSRYINKEIGTRVVVGDCEYFAFQNKVVAFLVAPAAWRQKVRNPHGFDMHTYEDLVLGQ